MTSGRDSSAWTSSYWRATSASFASRSLMTPVAGRSARTGSASVDGRCPRPRIGSRSNGVEPSGDGSPSASSACSIDTMATSIMSSDGCFVVIIWTRRPG